MNYETYFSKGQKVFLINLSEDRDESIFDAFSATIMNCDNMHFELRPRYLLHHGDHGHLEKGMIYKITAESFGAGVQFIGKIRAVNSNSFIMEPTDQMEMYQRGQVPRTDVMLGFRSFTKTAPLVFFKNEWKRFIESTESGRSSKYDLAATSLNLGVGGLRHVVNRSDHQTDLAMLFIDLEDGEPPVCSIAEQLWRRSLPDDDGIAVGRRFVLIRKSDQKRIQLFIERHFKKQKKGTLPDKNNWELLDRMIYNR